VWCAIAVTMMVCNCHFFFTFDLILVPNRMSGNNDTLECALNSQYKYFWLQQWYWIDATVRIITPFCLIFPGNLLIVSRIIISNRRRKHRMQAARRQDNNSKDDKVGFNFIFLSAIESVQFEL
jgi:hypothetical protein